MHKKYFGDTKLLDEAVNLTRQLGDVYRELKEGPMFPGHLLSAGEMEQLDFFPEPEQIKLPLEENFGSFTISTEPMPELQMYLMGLTKKTLVDYIIVTTDGQCLELFEQEDITPQEAVNVCKFISLVQMLASHAAHGLQIQWLDIVKNLGIERHFVEGLKDYTLYPSNNESLHVFLFDPK